jgi:hypothetical protein
LFVAGCGNPLEMSRFTNNQLGWGGPQQQFGSQASKMQVFDAVFASGCSVKVAQDGTDTDECTPPLRLSSIHVTA